MQQGEKFDTFLLLLLSGFECESIFPPTCSALPTHNKLLFKVSSSTMENHQQTQDSRYFPFLQHRLMPFLTFE